MKKVKLTPEEKAEAKKDKKSWNEMIRRLTKKGAILEQT
jgi:hypothetical protein